MEKLVTVIMGQNAMKFLPMCLESVKESDAIVYCDGNGELQNNEKDDGTIVYLVANGFNAPNGYSNRVIITNRYNQEDPEMNGKQRNFYLDYVKKNYPDYWCLVLDADEVVEDLNKIKQLIQTAPSGLYSVHMRHFHNDLGHEDSTQEKHWVLNRLFKVNLDVEYPNVEHPVLSPKVQIIPENQEFEVTEYFRTDVTPIWHLAHINHCFNIKNRYEKNLKHSNIHSKEFLESWNEAHCLGLYPNKQVNPIEIPEIILNYFHINKDKFYFANRVIDLKHPIMVKQWNDYFNPESVLDLGCGRGPYLYFWKWFVKDYAGIELSKWAVEHAFCDHILNADITNYLEFGYDLVTALDVLEHLDNEQLDKALTNISKWGKRFLFSIPFVGDPNLVADKTHKQFRTKEEWSKLIESYGIKIEETPKDWLFNNQMLVGKNENN